MLITHSITSAHAETEASHLLTLLGRSARTVCCSWRGARTHTLARAISRGCAGSGGSDVAVGDSGDRQRERWKRARGIPFPASPRLVESGRVARVMLRRLALSLFCPSLSFSLSLSVPSFPDAFLLRHLLRRHPLYDFTDMRAANVHRRFVSRESRPERKILECTRVFVTRIFEYTAWPLASERDRSLGTIARTSIFSSKSYVESKMGVSWRKINTTSLYAYVHIFVCSLALARERRCREALKVTARSWSR